MVLLARKQYKKQFKLGDYLVQTYCISSMVMSNSSSSSKSKRTSVTRFTLENNYGRIKALEKVLHKGDWWHATVWRLAVKKTS